MNKMTEWKSAKMTKKDQNAMMLLLASMFAMFIGRLETSGSPAMDFTQGLLLGIGIAGCLAALWVFGKDRKNKENA